MAPATTCFTIAHSFSDWVEDAPGVGTVAGPWSLGVAIVLLLAEAARSRRRSESAKRVRWLLLACMVLSVIVIAYWIVRFAESR